MTPMLETPITSADKTFIALRKDIVEGEIASGSKLVESELSTKYQVSRAIIRESINRLENVNLVERKANVGANVVTLSHNGLIQLYQVRESLEGMAARLAAKHMSQSEIDTLSDLLRRHFEKVKDSQSYYQEAGDVDFHYRIVLGSHNQHLISMLMNNIYHLVRMYRVQLGMAGPRVTTAFEEHQNIVKAIANRDEELAEMLMRRHIAYSRNNIEHKLRTINL
ncbi:GntR family transcriptional regulator [Glaciecola sp. 2405UD65-10]|uniref:GntR family transcriptional regulator n=1 Tax=Glaciecola sp. 2405UD65-10 TaxID=3397244 RepID=UPI003B5CB2BD